MTANIDTPIVDLPKKLAHIDQMLTDHMDHKHKPQEQESASASPWLAAITGMAAGATIFAAGPR